jgi:purine-binding chemotaxis protein CheW
MGAADATLLSFRVAERRFALDAARVAEVVRPPAVTRVPNAPPSLAGVAALRGRVLPVIALDRLLGVESQAAGLGRLIVLAGAEPMGLAVDEVIGLEAGEARGLVETADGVAQVVPLEDMLERAFAGVARRTAARAAQQAPSAATGEAASESLLAFNLAGQPYVLPLAVVREVIAVPPDIAALPRTDAAMVGVAALNGVLTPIVSTRVLLGLAAAGLTAAARVVVIALGEARIGLAVDQVSAIIHAPPSAIGPVPKVLNRGAGEAQVTAMLRTAGDGLVSVLDPARLFAEESVAQILADAHGGADAATDGRARAEPAALQRALVFQLGDESYGLDIAAVEEVTAMPQTLARLPHAPAYVLGVMARRGEPVPVIDQRGRFGVGAVTAAARPRVIVTRIGELVAGFAVDAVSQILELTDDQLSPTPQLTGDAVRLFDRVAQIESEGRVLLLVNPQELLDRAERDLMSALAGSSPPS